MSKYQNFMRTTVRKVTNSIAFYPSFLALLWILEAIVSLRIEHTEFIDSLQDHLPFLLVSDADTARTLLSTFLVVC